MYRRQLLVGMDTSIVHVAPGHVSAALGFHIYNYIPAITKLLGHEFTEWHAYHYSEITGQLMRLQISS